MTTKHGLAAAAALLVVASSVTAAHRDRPPKPARRSGPPAPSPPAKLVWSHDYRQAYEQARREERMLLINFTPPAASSAQQQLETAITTHPAWRAKLSQLVLARLPQDAEIQIEGEAVALLAHPAFREMHRGPGIAVIDLAHPAAEFYGQVVSAFPFVAGKYYRWQSGDLALILDLPPGTITQRTMVWAVRRHPEKPASTDGAASLILLEAATKHSQRQAALGVQGHHDWEGRFHRLRGRLRGGLPVEVVAESWPGQTMVDSCIDCVESWRQSPGHWSAVRRRHGLFGFDIRRGRNGIWYGTGIFASQ